MKTRSTLLLAAVLAVSACSGAKPAAVSSTKAVNDDNTPPANKWAALAFGVQWIDQAAGTGNNYFGRAVSENTEFSAKDAAIGACAADTCEIKTYVNVGCLSIAHGFENEPSYREWYGFGGARFDGATGATVAERKHNTRVLAGETSIEGCDGGTLNRNCTVKETFCTWDNTGASTAEQITQWVLMMGGEPSPGVQNTLQYFTVITEAGLRNAGLTYDQARCVAGGRWARVGQVATSCGLSTGNLDDVYALANGLSH